jgi:hypothetical protein
MFIFWKGQVMQTRCSKRRSGNSILKRIVLFFLVAQFVICTTALGDLINIISGDQHLEGQTGWKEGGEPSNDIDQFVPESPQGPTNANLDLSLANFGVSIVASLDSSFSEDQIEASGSGIASAVWDMQPEPADDIHGGGGSTFTLSFTRKSSPAYFYVAGQIDYRIEGAPGDGDHPERVVADVRLSSGDGDTIEWEEAIIEEDGDISIAFADGVWLESGKTYLLEAYAGAGVGITPGKTSSDSQLNSASFSFTATASAVSIDIVQDTISNKTKTITCNIWPPIGIDVTRIDQGSILLNGETSPDQISVRKHQQMLVVKFPISGLTLDPGTLNLTVTGNLNDETPFEGTDSVEVVQKGGKPN